MKRKNLRGRDVASRKATRRPDRAWHAAVIEAMEPRRLLSAGYTANFDQSTGILAITESTQDSASPLTIAPITGGYAINAETPFTLTGDASTLPQYFQQSNGGETLDVTDPNVTAIDITTSASGSSVSVGGGSYPSLNIVSSDGLTVQNGITVSGNLAVTADAVTFGGAVNAGTGTVSIAPYTSGNGIVTDSTLSGYLSLSTSTLDEITAGTLALGNASTGPLLIAGYSVPSGVTTLDLQGSSLAAPGPLPVSTLNIDITGSSTLNLGNVDNPSGNINLSHAGSITLTDAVSTPDDVSLTSSDGAISESGGSISAASVDASAATGITLSGSNEIGTFSATNSTSGNVSLTDSASNLSLGNVVNSAGGGNVNVSNTGSISLAGALSAPDNISLTSADGAVDQASSGENNYVSASNLNVSAATGVTMGATGVNTISAFSATDTTSGGVSLSDAASNLVLGSIDTASGGNVTVFSAGSITASGPITGSYIEIYSTGGTHTITLDTLSGQPTLSGDGMTLGASAVQVSQQGTINSPVIADSGSLSVNTGTTTLSLALDAAPVGGQQITIANMTGSSGAALLANLPDGGLLSTVYNGTTYYFTASYEGGSGHDLVLTAVSATPSLTSLSATSAALDSTAAVPITVTGSSFFNNSVINFNGAALSTTYVNGTTLSATIPASDLTTAGSDSITVSTPGASASSSALPFVVGSLTVNTTSDASSLSAGQESLRGAIAYAESLGGAQTITFAPSLAGQTIALGGSQLEISSANPITIDASGIGGITISGNDASRVFQVDSGANVTFNDLTINGGTSTSPDDGINGGDVYNGGTLTVLSSDFNGNDNKGSNGGGIYNTGTLTVTDSTFDGLTAYTGGAIENVGTATITNSTLSNDMASDPASPVVGLGGGIDNWGTLTLTNSTLADDSASENGGGIWNAGALTVNSSTLADNTAGGGGGAIFNVFGSATIINSTLLGNTAYTSGGIFNAATLGVADSTLDDNSAAELDGGGGGIVNSGSATLNNTIIANSTGGDIQNAGTLGGSYDLIGDGSDLADFANSISGNPLLGTLGNYGGPTETIPLLAGSAAIGAGVTVPGVTTDQRGVARPATSPDIGAYQTTSLKVTSATVSSNNANSPSLAKVGDTVSFAITLSGPFTVTGSPSLTLTDGQTVNTFTVNGNTITFSFVVTSSTPNGILNATALNSTGITPSSADFVNTSNFSGTTDASTIDVMSTAPTVSFSPATLTGTIGTPDVYTVTFNRPVTGVTAADFSNAGTAGITIGSLQQRGNTYTLAVTPTTLGTIQLQIGSQAIIEDGAGNQLATPATDTNVVSVPETPSLVVNTTSDVVDPYDGLTSLREAISYAESLGGAQTITFAPSLAGQTIALDGSQLEISSANPITIDASGIGGITISGNDASRVFQVDSGANVTFNDLTINGGTSTSPDDGINGGLGGDVYNGGTLTVLSSDFNGSDNKGSNGGGIYNKGALTVANSTFDGLTAYTGGAIENTGTATITNSTLSNDMASDPASPVVGLGGGIDNSGTLTLTNSTLADDSASESGGGIWNSGIGKLTVNSSTFANNSAAYGGGIESSSYLTFTVINSTIAGNSATYGGGIDSAGPLVIADSTIANNSAQAGDGGGIYTSGSTMVINNSIIANSGSGGDIGYSTTQLSGSSDLIDDGSDLSSFTNSISGNALLGTLGNYGGPTETIPLLPGSPAIDAGTPVSGITTDQRGNLRSTTTPDIGAFESGGFTIQSTGGSGQDAFTGDGFQSPLTATVVANNPLEPVAGGTITFAGPGTGASLASSVVATIGAGGVVSAPVTAGSTAGDYSVTASASGVAAPAPFALGNVTVSFGSNSLTYNGQPQSPSYTLTPSDASATVTYMAMNNGPHGKGLAGAPTDPGSYSETVTVGGVSETDDFSINAATPTLSLTANGGVYDGAPIGASVTVAGISGSAASSLEGVTPTLTYYSGSTASGTPLAGAPTDGGTYTVVASFTGSTDYAAATTSANFSITPAATALSTPVVPPGIIINNPVTTSAQLTYGSGSTPAAGVPITFMLVRESDGATTYLTQSTGADGTASVTFPASAFQVDSLYQIVASYGGDSSLSSATSTPVSFGVYSAANLTMANTFTATAGVPTTLTATLSEAPTTPTGAPLGNLPVVFTFSDANGTIGTANGNTNAAGVASVTPTFSIPEAVNVTASFYDPSALLTGPTGTFPITAATASGTVQVMGTPALAVSDAGGTYTGNPFGASATVNGGATLQGVGLTLDYTNTVTNTDLGSTAPTSAGNYSVTASFAGSSDYVATSKSVAFTISQATPTLKLTANGGAYDAAAIGASVTVAGISGTAATSLEGITPTLAYYSGSTAKGTPLSGAPTNAGTYTVVATFAGSTDYSATSISKTYSIAAAGTAVSLQSSAPSGSTPGQSVTFTADVSALSPGGGVPTGTVQFYVDNVAYGSPVALSNGVASIADSSLTTGNHSITATYVSSSSNFTGSATASPLSQAVSKPAATLSNLSAPTIVYNTILTTLGGNIAGASGLAKPTGTVTISASYDGQVLASQKVNLSSSGSFSATFLSIFAKVGQYTLTYSYSGDSNYAATTTTTTGYVTYNVNPQAPAKTKAGSTIALKMSLTDVFGLNVGSSSEAVTATGIASASDPNAISALPAGNSPTFTYSSGVYSLNLKTTGLSAGTYLLYFTAANDSIVHDIEFTLD